MPWFHGLLRLAAFLACVPHAPAASGALDHFSWDPVPSPQIARAPFAVTLRGLDAAGAPADVSSPVTLTARTDTRTSPVGNPASLSTFFFSASPNQLRLQQIYTAQELGGAGRLTAISFDITQLSSAPLARWTLRLKHTPLAAFAGSTAWETNDWTLGFEATNLVLSVGWVRFPLLTPIDFNGADNLMVDISSMRQDFGTWTACRATQVDPPRAVYGISSSGTDPLLWSGTQPVFPFPIQALPNARFEFEGSLQPIPAAAGPFVNGVWTGQVSVPEPRDRVQLVADDGQGHVGVSEAFATGIPNDLRLLAGPLPAVLTAGDTLSYTLIVSNSGPAAATGVALTSQLGAGLAFSGAESAAGVPHADGQSVVLDVGTLAGGAVATMVVRATAVSAGLLTNTAFVAQSGSDPYSPNNRVELLSRIRPVPGVTVMGTITPEPDQGTIDTVFTVSLSDPSSQPVSVDYATTTNGTAAPGVDYIPVSGTLHFAPGEMSKTFNVPIVGDLLSEAAESIVVRITNPVHAVLGSDLGGAQIADNDPLPVVSVADVFVTRSASGSVQAAVPVTLSTASGQSVTVQFSAASGSALAGSDFSPTSGTLIFPPGAIRQEVVVTVLAGATPGTNEFFHFNLSSPSGAWLGSGHALVTLLDRPYRRLEWSSFPSPVFQGLPFTMSLTARDAAGNADTNYSGLVSVSAWTGAAATDPILITEIDPGAIDRVELMNVSTQAVDVTSWTIAAFDSVSWPLARQSVVLPPGSICPPGSQFRLLEWGFPITHEAFPESDVPVLSWNDAGDANPIAVMVRNARGEVVDFVAAGDAVPGAIQHPVAVPDDRWSGPALPLITQPGQSYQRIGSRNSRSAAGWTNRASTFGQTNPGLTLPFTGDLRPVPIQPQGPFALAQGFWTGSLVITGNVTGVRLQATDENGLSFPSALFDVRDLPPLSLVVPSATTQGVGTLQGQVMFPSPLVADLVVSLQSSDASEILVPASVTALAGQSSVSFDLLVQQNATLEGSQAVLLTATAPGYFRALGSIVVADRESATLGLSLPPTALEGTSNLSGTLTLSTAPARDVLVRLSAIDPSVIVPATVTLPAGTTSVPFLFGIADNRRIDGTRTAAVIAHVDNWVDGSAELAILDDENNQLVLGLPPQSTEGAAILSGGGSVQISGTLATNLVLKLGSGDPTEVTLSSTVTIPAGKTNAIFDVTIEDDPDFDGSQTVVSDVSAPGFNPASATTVVLDNDIHHLRVSAVPSPQLTPGPIPITVTAESVEGLLISSVSPDLVLTATSAEGRVSVLRSPVSSMAAGVWTGTVTISVPARDLVLRFATFRGAVGLSNPFNVLSGGVRVLNLPLLDLVADPSGARLYASVGENGGAYSNSVVVIDPAAGTVETSIPAGVLSASSGPAQNRPGRLAVSSDGTLLYVASTNAEWIKRIDLATRAVTQTIPVGVDAVRRRYGVVDMAVRPNVPRSLVVSRGQGYGGVDIAVFSLDVAGASSPLFPQVASLVWAETGARVFASSSSALFDISVSTGSLTQRGSPAGVISGLGVEIQLQGGLLFTGDGVVFDPAAGRVAGRFDVHGRMLTFPSFGHVAPDLANGRVFFVTADEPEHPQDTVIECFQWPTRIPLGEYRITNAFGSTTRLVRWGTNGLAFTSQQGLHLLNLPRLIPRGDVADLRLSMDASPASVSPGDLLTYTLTVTNGGPAAATDVIVSGWLPDGATLVSSSPTFLPVPTNSGPATVNLGGIAAGELKTLQVVVRPGLSGASALRANVVANEPDPEYANNVSRRTVPVSAPLAPGAISVVRLPVRDLALDGPGRKLYASVGPDGGDWADRIVALDLATGFFDPGLSAGADPALLRLSSDARRLFVGTRSNSTVDVLNLDSRSVEQTIPLGSDGSGRSLTIADMAAVPESPGSIAVERQTLPTSIEGPLPAGLVIYDAGVPRGGVNAPSGRARRLLFGTNGLLHAYFDYASEFHADTLRLGDDGVSILAADQHTGLPVVTDLVASQGLLFAGTGEALRQSDLRFLGTCLGMGVSHPDRVNQDGLVAADVNSDRLFYLVGSFGGWKLHVFSLSTFRILGQLDLPSIQGAPRKMVHFDRDGIAFNTSSNQLFLIRVPFISNGSASDLAMEIVSLPGGGVVGSDVRVEAWVRNLGPETANQVTVSWRTSSNLLTHVVSAGQGSAPAAPGTSVQWNVGTLVPGASTMVFIDLTCTAAGMGTVAVQAGGAVSDDVPANDSARGLVTVAASDGPAASFDVFLPVNSIAVSPLGGTLFATVAGLGGDFANQLWEFDADRFRTVSLSTVGSDPGAQAFSADGRVLNVGLDGERSVLRFDPVARVPDSRFALPQLLRATSLTAVPLGHDGLLAVRNLAWGRGSPTDTALYWGGVEVTNFPGTDYAFAPTPADGGVFALLRSPGSGRPLSRWDISADGITRALPLGWQLAAGPAAVLSAARGEVYAGSGEVFDNSGAMSGVFPSDRPLFGGTVHAAAGLAYFLRLDPPGQARLHAFDLVTFREIGSSDLPAGARPPLVLAGVGMKRIAVLNGARRLWILTPQWTNPDPGPDLDGDGMPDAWESLHGLIAGIKDGAADADLDGLTNLEEYQAGTDPQNAASRLFLEVVRGDDGTLALRFPTVGGRRYRVERTAALGGVQSGWGIVEDEVSGRGIPVRIPIDPGPEGGAGFYRVRLLP